MFVLFIEMEYTKTLMGIFTIKHAIKPHTYPSFFIRTLFFPMSPSLFQQLIIPNQSYMMFCLCSKYLGFISNCYWLYHSLLHQVFLVTASTEQQSPVLLHHRPSLDVVAYCFYVLEISHRHDV